MRAMEADQKRLIRVWLPLAGGVNGFGNETRRDCREEVRRDTMAGPGD